MFAKVSSIRSAHSAVRILAAAAAVVLGAIAGSSAPSDMNWISYGGGADSSRYFDSKEITKAVAGRV
jgi:hypothetical protein